MRRSILLLSIITFFTVVCTSPLKAPDISLEAMPHNTTREVLPAERLMELALAGAHAWGLETIDGEPVTQWMTQGEWLARHGLGISRADPTIPVLVFAFRGSGYWGGAAELPPGERGPIPIDGVTFALNGFTGEGLGAGGSFDPPPYMPKYPYMQIVGRTTLAYFPPILTPVPETTIEPESTSELMVGATPKHHRMQTPRYSTEEMLEIAEDQAHAYGLQTITAPPEYIWAAQGDNAAGLGGMLIDNNLPVFVVAFRGTGYWAGAGMSVDIDGTTLVLNGLSGEVLVVAGGYIELPLSAYAEAEHQVMTITATPMPAWPPVTPPPQAFPEEILIGKAEDLARINGLETFDGAPLIKWMTRPEWAAYMGLGGYGPKNRIAVFTVAFRGSGEYRGIGGAFPVGGKMDGFTITLNPVNADVISTSSGFNPPPDSSETVKSLTALPEAVNVLPEAVAPVHAAQLAVLLANAQRTAIGNGLEAVTIQYYMWTTRGEWFAYMSESGGFYFGDPSVPLLVVSMPGTGYWRGVGATFNKEPLPIDGITLAYTAEGSFSGSIGGFVPLPFVYEGPLPDFNLPALLTVAEETARAYGLETVSEPPVTMWMTRNAWETEFGLLAMQPQNVFVFVAAFRGTFTWPGIASDPRPVTLDGLTFALSPDGSLLGIASGYRPPPYVTPQLVRTPKATPQIIPSPEVTIEPEFTHTPAPTGTPAPTRTPRPTLTPQPFLMIEPQFTTEEMLERAEEMAHTFGLETIDGEPEWMWIANGVVETLSGTMSNGINPSLPVFIASYHGTGIWRGFGGPMDGSPLHITGITIELDGLTGNLTSVRGGPWLPGQVATIAPEP